MTKISHDSETLAEGKQVINEEDPEVGVIRKGFEMLKKYDIK